MEQKIFCEKTYYETKSFKIVQARYWRKFNFEIFPKRSQIFELVKNFEATPHTIAALKAAITERIQVIVQEECVYIINDLAHRIQQYFQLNSTHLGHVLLRSSWRFRFTFKTKWLQVLKYYYSIF